MRAVEVPVHRNVEQPLLIAQEEHEKEEDGNPDGKERDGRRSQAPNMPFRTFEERMSALP